MTQQAFTESITLDPALMRPGEPVTIRLTSGLEFLPLTLEVTVNYLEQEFTVGEGIRVTWDTSGVVKHGQAVFVPERPGSHLVRFGERHRAFAVVGDVYTVCSVILPFASSRYARGNLLDFYHPDIHTRPLPVDYCIPITDRRSMDPDWDVHKMLRAFRAIYGDGVLPCLDGQDLHVLDPGLAGRGLQELSEADALAVMQAVHALWKALGYGTPIVMGLYDPGEGVLRAAGRLGLLGIAGIRGDVPHEPFLYSDGQRMAEFPWWLSRQMDERKPTTVINPGLYHACGRASPGNMNALYEDVDDLIAEGTCYCTFVLDGDDAEVIEMNRLLLARLVEKPRAGRVVFVRAGDITGYLLRTA